VLGRFDTLSAFDGTVIEWVANQKSTSSRSMEMRNSAKSSFSDGI